MNVHIGKRGLVLLMFGGVFITYGLALKDVPQRMSLPLYSGVPITWQGWAWAATGALACLAALSTSREWWGFTVLFPMPSLWTVGFLVGFLSGKLPPNGALLWALLVGILLVLADWPEPPPTVKAEREGFEL